MEFLEALEKAKQAGVAEVDFRTQWELELEEKRQQREDRRREREEREKEQEERDKEREFELKKLEKQTELASVSLSDSKVRQNISPVKGPRIPTFNDTREDLDSYLKRFERLATASLWAKDTWADRLGALLTGRALDVYSGLDDNESHDYEKVKGELFKKYLLTAEEYRKRFRLSKPEKDETFTQLAVRLERYLDRWVELSKTEKTLESFKDLVVREQLLKVAEQNLSIYLKERDPKSVSEMVMLADLYRQAHQTGRGQEAVMRPQGRSTIPVAESKTENEKGKTKSGCFLCGSFKHIAKFCDKKDTRNRDTRQRIAAVVTESPGKQGSRGCFKCGSLYHIARFCRQTQMETVAAMVVDVATSKLEETRAMEALDESGERPAHAAEVVMTAKTSREDRFASFMTEGRMAGQKVSVLRDTGCTCAVVRRDLVPPEALTGREKTYILMDGTVRRAPEARVWVETSFYTGWVTALAVEKPVADVLIGNIEGASLDSTDHVGAVCTRANKKRKEEEERNVSSHDRANSEEEEEDNSTPQISKLSREDLIRAQEKDPSLSRMWEKSALEKPEESDAWFRSKRGILYRMKEQKTGDALIEQIIVPQPFRLEIMKIAHESVFGGHLGTGRTLDRIQQSFHWPGIGADVVRFCRSCDACQRTTSKGKTSKAPLVPTPLIDTPFSRVAVDLIGPLSRSDKGNAYILTMVDYATRFPEAKALPKITAELVSEALMEIFSRLGVPDEIVSDRGSQFTGELMREVSRLLKTKQLFTSPYHAMSNGLCERFNGTLKGMLRRIAHDHPKKWCSYLSPLLFAYRETPQSSTGFSPFQLVFGHSVKGPLSILKDLWKGEATSETRLTYEYVIDMRERLQEALEIANQNVEEEQKKQKRYYDRGAKHRKLKPGEKVLILLPLESSKLTMTWRGPYVVEERKGPVDYIINVKGKRRLYHINMLKQYHQRGQQQENVVASAILTERDAPREVEQVTVENGLPQLVQTESFDDVTISSHLQPEEQEQAF